MNQLAQFLLTALAALGLGVAYDSEARSGRPSRPLGRAPAPATAIYRCLATPEAEGDAAHWLHTRSGAHGFSGVDVSNPRASAAHAELLGELARSCAPGGSLPAGVATAIAFGHEFTRHAPARSIAADGVVEVWWSRSLELPLVIVRQRQGRTLVDELVHLSLEERADLLVR